MGGGGEGSLDRLFSEPTALPTTECSKLCPGLQPPLDPLGPISPEPPAALGVQRQRGGYVLPWVPLGRGLRQPCS